MGAGAWQCGAERKLGEREKPSEISLRSLLNFPSTKSERRKKRAMLVYVKEAGRKRKLEELVFIARRCFNVSVFDKAFRHCWERSNQFAGLISL